MTTVGPDAARPTLDHLAIGVRAWSDAYPRFVGELGGGWLHGGASGDFAPFQLTYGDGMRLEFIAPHAPDGFMRRFMDRRGPSAHHITFRTPSLEATAEALHRHGFETFGGRTDLPMWRERFVHPTLTSLGTLLQVAEADEAYLAAGAEAGGPPADFPGTAPPGRPVAWFGLTSPDLARARALLAGALHGAVAEEGAGWFRTTWGPGRSILVRDAGAEPGSPRLWSGAPPDGVAHLLFGPAECTVEALRAADGPTPMPAEPATGVPIWLA